MPRDERKHKHVWMVEDVEEGVVDKVVDGKPQRERTFRAFWTKVGVAFENKDGSWDLRLAAIPVTGRMVIRDPMPKG
jgi:hypothetical protein